MAWTSEQKVNVAWAVGRMLITWAGASALAFAVSHYVVQQRTASLDTALEAINQSISTGMVAQTEAINTSLKTIGDSFSRSIDGLNESLSLLNSTITETNKRVAQLNDGFVNISEATAVNSTEIKHLKSQVESVEASVERTGQEFKTAFENAGTEMSTVWANTFVDSLVNNEVWDKYRSQFDAGDNAPILVEIPLKEGKGDAFNEWFQNNPNPDIRKDPFIPSPDRD